MLAEADVDATGQDVLAAGHGQAPRRVVQFDPPHLFAGRVENAHLLAAGQVDAVVGPHGHRAEPLRGQSELVCLFVVNECRIDVHVLR